MDAVSVDGSVRSRHFIILPQEMPVRNVCLVATVSDMTGRQDQFKIINSKSGHSELLKHATTSHTDIHHLQTRRISPSLPI
jgi:hypothetical protein